MVDLVSEMPGFSASNRKVVRCEKFKSLMFHVILLLNELHLRL